SGSGERTGQSFGLFLCRRAGDSDRDSRDDAACGGFPAPVIVRATGAVPEVVAAKRCGKAEISGLRDGPERSAVRFPARPKLRAEIAVPLARDGIAAQRFRVRRLSWHLFN